MLKIDQTHQSETKTDVKGPDRLMNENNETRYGVGEDNQKVKNQKTFFLQLATKPVFEARGLWDFLLGSPNSARQIIRETNRHLLD